MQMTRGTKHYIGVNIEATMNSRISTVKQFDFVQNSTKSKVPQGTLWDLISNFSTF
jgi:hypothetical protein